MKYLQPAEVLLLHSTMVDELGGRHGINDVDILKRALAYVRNNSMFPDMYTKASALLFALAKKKPFADLNTVTAVAATQLFLSHNGYSIDIGDSAIKRFIKNELLTSRLVDIASWLKRYAEKSNGTTS